MILTYFFVETPFLNNKTNSLISLLENLNVFLNRFFDFSSIFFEQSLLQNRLLYFIKLSLVLSYWRKKNHNLYIFIFGNSFIDKISRTLKWTCHKSCTINKFSFVRYSNQFYHIYQFLQLLFLLQQKKYCTFLCFPLDIQIAFQIPMLITLW